MTKEKMLDIARKNIMKAEKALANNINRKGITQRELEDLSANVDYAKIVYGLIVENVKK